MLYFKTQNNEPWQIEDSISENDIIQIVLTNNLTPITKEEFEEICNIGIETEVSKTHS